MECSTSLLLLRVSSGRYFVLQNRIVRLTLQKNIEKERNFVYAEYQTYSPYQAETGIRGRSFFDYIENIRGIGY